MAVKIITPYPKRTDFASDVIHSIREFLIHSFNGEGAQWPGYHCTVLMDGYPRKISGGTYYQIYNNEIYVSHDQGSAVPEWVPGVLIAIAVFFRLHDDAEIRGAAIDALARSIAGVVLPYQQMLVESYNGKELHEIAINAATKELAAKIYDDQGVGRYVLQSGVEVDFQSEEEWHAFAVPVGRY